MAASASWQSLTVKSSSAALIVFALASQVAKSWGVANSGRMSGVVADDLLTIPPLASNGNNYQDLAHAVHSLLTVTGPGAPFFVRRELRSSCAAFRTDLT